MSHFRNKSNCISLKFSGKQYSSPCNFEERLTLMAEQLQII